MNKVYQRINWQNEPSISTPLNETNLNKIDYALDVVDGRVVTFDTTKANQSDLLQTVKTVAYNTTTGVFTFTFWNGNTVTADLNIEKIPVDFSMDEYGVITMTTADGTTYTCDISELIKLYTFNDSSEIDFTITTDASGNKTITASIVSGSITGDKLQPNYLADCVNAKTGAETAETNAGQSARDAGLSSEDSEAWAVGERNGQPVPSTDPTYENNAKWWAQHGTGSSFAGLSDTNFTNLQNGQIAKYNSATQKWENTEDEGGLLPHFKITSEAGSTVTVVLPDGVTTITPTQTSSGIWQCDVPSYGVYTVHAVINGDDAVRTVTVDTVKEYVIHDEHYSYTLNVYAPTGSSILVTDGSSETYTGTGAGSTAVIFALHQASTNYTITVTYDGLTITDSVTTPSTSGGSGSKTITFGTINLTVDEDLIGETIVMTKGTDTVSKVASSTSMVFYPNATGNWRISVDYEGETVYATPDPIVVSSLSTPVSAELTLVTIPEGATVTPTDDIQTWLACANITDKSYTTLAEVLADRETFETLIADSNACDYMARSTTWAGSNGVTYNETAMALIGKYDYCSNALLSNATWREAICNSDYFEEVLNVKVPVMTSATTPSGQVISSGYATSYDAWKAFDGNSSTQGAVSQGANGYIGYKFTEPVKIYKIYFDDANGNHRLKTYQIQSSDTGNSDDWDDVSEVLTVPSSFIVDENFFNDTAREYIRIFQLTTQTAGQGNISYFTIQFYGRASSNVSNTNGIIHTAMGNESVYCVETGDTFTATDGIAIVDFSDFDEGVYTFGSTTAKNPSDLSQDYTKQFRITKSPYGGTTELYLMPDTVKTLYWWGYKSDDIQYANTSDGWQWSNGSFVNPSEQTNYLDLSTTASQNCMVSCANAVNISKVYGIVEGITLAYTIYGQVAIAVNKNLSNDFLSQANITTTSLHLEQTEYTQGNYYPVCCAAIGRRTKCYALWYE